MCCGPNAAYFTRRASLDALVDHIYGRARVPLLPERPHMLLKELSLHIECLRRDLARQAVAPTEQLARGIAECGENLWRGIAHYRELAAVIGAPQREAFASRLAALEQELTELLPTSADARLA